MTPKFTTPCYVRVDDPQERKEICEKLKMIGYRDVSTEDDVWLMTQATDNTSEYLVEYMKIAINCDTDTELFIALASMRKDTDKGQWFMRIGINELYLCKVINFNNIKNINGFYRRATATEIINYHKQKGE